MKCVAYIWCVCFSLIFLAVNTIWAQAPTGEGGFSLPLSPNEARPIDQEGFLSKVYVRDSSYTYLVNEDSQEWQLTSRRVITYGSDGLRKVSTRSILNNGIWEPNSRTTFTYGQGKTLTAELISTWHADDLQWKNDLERRFFYNYAGLENEVMTLAWDGLRWKMNQLITKEYTPFNAVSTEVHFQWEDASWKPVRRTLFDYESERILSETQQLWVDSIGDWVNSIFREFNYDGNNKLVLTTQSVWDQQDAKFVSAVSTIMEYNAQGQLMMSEQIALTDGNNFELTSQDVSYDSDGNPEEVIHSDWDPDTGEWLPSRRILHFWSHLTLGNLADAPTRIFCRFPNPYTVGLPWFCESLKQNVPYTLELYDQLGRLHYQSTFIGHHTFRITRQVPAGYYTAVIRGGLDVHTEKVIVRP